MQTEQEEKLQDGGKYKLNVKKKSTLESAKTIWEGWKDNDMKEIVQNSVICAEATYQDNDEDCYKFFTKMNSDNHNISQVTRSQHGKCHFILAVEDRNNEGLQGKNRLYIAFRGTTNSDDWQDNMKAFQIDGTSQYNLIKGKFHAGFFERAVSFPFEMILSEEDFKDREIVICGHSLGGAVATIVAIIMMAKEASQNKAGSKGRSIKCVTFGSPLIGDETLKKFCDMEGFSENIFHIINDQDPVPRLLSFGQFLTGITKQIDNQIKSAVESIPDIKQQYEELRRQYGKYAENIDYYKNILSIAISVLTPLLGVASVYYDTLGTASKITEFVKYVTDETDSTSSPAKRAFINGGNYLFLALSQSKTTGFAWNDDESIRKSFELSLDRHISDTIEKFPLDHAANSYTNISQAWSGKRGDFSYNDLAETAKLTFVKPRYVPEITEAEIVKVDLNGKDVTRLRLTGKNLTTIILEDCEFNIGYPFASEKEVRLQKFPLDGNAEEIKVIIEEDFNSSINISDHGTVIKVKTLFGQCQHKLKNKEPRQLKIKDSNNDAISVVIRRAIQRGLGLTLLKRGHEGFDPAEEIEIAYEVLHLASKSLKEEDFERLKQIFMRSNKNDIQAMMNNARDFQQIQDICEKIQSFLKTLPSLEAPGKLNSKMKNVLVATGGILGGVAICVVAFMLGAYVASAGVAGVAAAGGGAYGVKQLISDKGFEENYEAILKFLNSELLQMLKKGANSAHGKDHVRHAADLQETKGIFYLEKSLVVMVHYLGGMSQVQEFKGCSLENCTVESKKALSRRISCIIAIHNIRDILASQYFIGVVGIQDAGNGLHKKWKRLFFKFTLKLFQARPHFSTKFGACKKKLATCVTQWLQCSMKFTKES